MSHFLGQRWLADRRTFLRGTGASIALPLLNCMGPLAAKAGGPNDGQPVEKPRRSVFIYVPNGVNVLSWQIKTAGAEYELSAPLRSLEPHRSKITPISGLHHPSGIGGGHEVGKVWLTAARVSQSGGPFRNTVSCDQVMAETTSPHTRFGSLEVSTGTGANSNLAWTRDGVPLPVEDNPRRVFHRMFGAESGGREERRRKLDRQASVLDRILDDARALRGRIGSEDRTRLDEYLEAVRSVEVRTQRLSGWLDVPRPRLEPQVVARFDRDFPKSEAGEYYRVMYDLIALALRTDMTRVVTYLNGGESGGGGLAIPEIGLVQSRHELSHHNGDPEQMDRLTRADTFLVEQFSYFLQQLDQIRDGEETLLDRTMVLFGSGMSYGQSHGNANLPTIFAGGGALGLKHGRHLDFNLPKIGQYDLTTPAKHYPLCGRPLDEKARLSNLLATMLHKMDAQHAAFADSLQPMSELIA